ncbi:OmpA family protein [Niabella aurantiaca]|uniref:OmpA family protein n=1 Tax=Niabella aurantiaca TaxID=379900 RepID=UPI00035DFE0E|nr:OmpA family protein [Niabella aurantiaca]
MQTKNLSIAYGHLPVRRKQVFCLFFAALLLLVSLGSRAQSGTEVNGPGRGFRFGLNAGYDLFPNYKNNTPYIRYKGGISAGLTAGYYWKWFSLGADVDYLKNSPENTYPTDSVFDPVNNVLIKDFALTKQDITRIFYGIGPGMHYTDRQGRFAAELNGRVGLASIKGGSLALTGRNGSAEQVLNYHGGYNLNNVLSLKGSLTARYFFNDFLGMHIGAYYIRHLNTKDAIGPTGYSAAYRAFEPNGDQVRAFTEKDLRKIGNSCACDISSIGAYAGVTLRLPSRKNTRTPVPAPVVVPVPTETCNTCAVYALAVTARDQYTKEVLPHTDIAVKDASGNIVKSGVTNSFGVAVFSNMTPGNYAINGKLYGVDLSAAKTAGNEFIANGTLQKELLYTDQHFILKGNAVVCNTATALPGATVVLRDRVSAVEKNTQTDGAGAFIFHLKQKSEMTVFGRKEKYFSQMVNISAADYDRRTTLFVKLEMCMEEADCDKAIRLENIHYDLDKYFIREDAKPELNRLVQFMSDNPGVRVELSSHTDSRASHAYNQKLSQNRADAARAYLVAKGIAGDRIVAKGYGETRLLNRCADGVNCPEAEHQFNRRTEMKVICPGR